MKHTKPPWKVIHPEKTLPEVVGVETPICTVFQGFYLSGEKKNKTSRVTEEECEANAEIIANAPTTKENHDKMYEALKKCVWFGENSGLGDNDTRNWLPRAKDILNSIDSPK